MPWIIKPNGVGISFVNVGMIRLVMEYATGDDIIKNNKPEIIATIHLSLDE